MRPNPLLPASRTDSHPCRSDRSTRRTARALPLGDLAIAWLWPVSVLAAAIGTTSLWPVAADTIELTNGKTVEGEVIEDVDDRPLVFRYKHGAEWKTTKVPRDKIAAYRRVPGNQADGADRGAGRKPADRSGRPARDNAGPEQAANGPATLPPLDDITLGDLQRTVAGLFPPDRAKKRELIVLSLRGHFAPANLTRIGDIISDIDLSLMLHTAVTRKPLAIVLAIDSGGGLVSEMDKIIDRLVELQSSPSDQRVVAWVHLGGSAAALTALSCKEIVMQPTGRMGSATAILADERAPAPRTALEKKQRAMQDARRRQVATLTSRSPLIQEAMEFPERRLWAHETKGFSATEPSGDGWTAIDDSTDLPLALDATELVRYGIAKGLAGTEKELLVALDLPEDTPVVTVDLLDKRLQDVLAPAKAQAADIYKEVDKAETTFTKKLDKLFDNLILAERSVNRIISQKSYSETDLALLKTSLTRCHIPFMKEETRQLLKEWAPERLARYETAMEITKGNMARAMQSTRVQGSSLPTRSISDDIRLSIDAVFYGRWGVPLSKE